MIAAVRRAAAGTLLALLAVVLVPAVMPAAAADARPHGVDDFAFSSLDVDYTLGRAEDGTSTLRVVETFVAAFPQTDQNRGMRRVIHTSYNGQPLHPELISVTDETGAPRPVEEDEEDGELSWTSRAGSYVHGLQTYVFTYDLQHVTWDFAATGTQELYWQVNGVDWPQPFDRVSATVRAAPELRAALSGEQACYVGDADSTAGCMIAPGTGEVVATASATDLAPYETMTVAIGFTPGTFVPFDTSPFATPFGWVQAAGIVAIAGAVVWAIAVRRRWLRDDAGRPTVIAEYDPPAGIDALIGSVIMGQSSKAVPAEVLEQAVVGSIRIFEGPKRLFGVGKMRAELVDPSRADADGTMLLQALFGDHPVPGAQYEFGRTDARFSKRATAMLSWAKAELTTRGLRRPVPAAVRIGPVALAIVAAVVGGISGVAAIGMDAAALLPVIGFVLGFIGVFAVFAIVARSPLTAAGAEARDHLLGLKTFISWAEEDRIRMLQSPTGAERVPVDVGDSRLMLRIYERLLPYAVVFGQEKQWAERLAVYYGSDSPTWYIGTAGFSVASFTSGISGLSATSSSSSGGAGGGGSAGGGGGGGGGGGV